MPGRADVVVIGGGPAGATVARLLADWGFDIVLIAGPRRASRRLAESLPPSTRSLLDTLGLIEPLARAGFLRSTGNTVWWGEGDPRIERFASGEASGYQVPRAAFDDLLLDLADASRARVIRDATARDVDLGGEASEPLLTAGSAATALRNEAFHEAAAGGAHSDGAADRASARVSCAPVGGGAVATIHARMVIDCSGRTGVIARRGLRRDEPGHRTVALAAAWRAPDGWTLPDDTHTLVEAFDRGWAWSIPVSRTVRFFTVMVDRGAWRGGARGYAEAIDRTRHLRALLAQGVLEGAPWGAEASLHAASRCAGANFLLAGDAATTLDPLSSFGVKKALASAWMAAIVANTCLTRPSHAVAEAARDLFEAREREMYDAGLAGVVSFARDAVRAYPASEFWRVRAETNLTGAGVESFEERCRRDPAVRDAFERLRARADVRLLAADDVRIERCPSIEGREVVLADALILPRTFERATTDLSTVRENPENPLTARPPAPPLESRAKGEREPIFDARATRAADRHTGDMRATTGVRFVSGVNLPAIVDLARNEPIDVPALFAAYLRAQPAVDLGRFLAALAVLVAHDALKIV